LVKIISNNIYHHANLGLWIHYTFI